MPSDRIKSHIHLHLIVFIWGFTAVLGALISIEADALVWYRMLLAVFFIFIFILHQKKSFHIPFRELFKLLFVGLMIAMHWVFFFKAIHTANVSITLAVFSIGAFLASILEPIFYKRKILGYEVIFGLVIIAALGMILQVEINYFEGIVYAFISVLLGVLFTLMNGKLIEKHDPSVITFYEFLAGIFFISVYFFIKSKFNASFFLLSTNDWILLLILSSVCTAYAFTASVKLLRILSPYTIMLTTSLEPVYGIVLAYYIIGGKEKMSPAFYFGAFLIIITVVLNGVVKQYFRNNK